MRYCFWDQRAPVQNRVFKFTLSMMPLGQEPYHARNFSSTQLEHILIMNSVDALSFDLVGIQECQQNRYPQLYIDSIVDVAPGISARGFKNFSYNEWFFPTHFKDDPNVPGYIQIESLVQTFIMTFLCMEPYKGMKTNFVNMNNVYFKRKIIPGDRLEIRATLDSFKRGIAKGSAESFVGEERACSADLLIAVPDVLDNFKPKMK